MMADAIVPQSVEDAYVKASMPVPLPIEQGGTSSTDYPNTFTQNTALSIMSKLTSDSVPLSWFNDLKY